MAKALTIGALLGSTLLNPTPAGADPPFAPDQDRDGLSDLEEYQARTRSDLADTDGDKLSDGREVHDFHTNPLSTDTDGDGTWDGYEINAGHTNPLDPKDPPPPAQTPAKPRDLDKDGLSDDDETNVHHTNPYNDDTDGDGRRDGFEVGAGTDPLTKDVDERGPRRPTERPDTDKDGLFDDDETQICGTNPRVADTDGDGPDDGQEVFDKTDPTKPNNP